MKRILRPLLPILFTAIYLAVVLSPIGSASHNANLPSTPSGDNLPSNGTKGDDGVVEYIPSSFSLPLDDPAIFNNDELIQLLQNMQPAASVPSTGVMVDVRDFGAVGDGKHDDTKAFRDAIASAKPYDTIYAPKTNSEYILSDTVTIEKNVHILFTGGIKYTGPRDRTVISTMGLLRCNINILYIRDALTSGSSGTDYWGGYHGYEDTNYTALMMTNSKWTNVSVSEITDFTTGVVCRALYTSTYSANGGGFWFNTINITQIKACLNGLELRSDSTKAWLNSNVFYNTSLLLGLEKGFLTSGDHYTALLQTCVNGNTFGADTNLFYCFRFEVAQKESTTLTNGTTYTAIYIDKMKLSSFLHYRSDFNGDNIQFCVLNFNHQAQVYSRTVMTYGLTFVPIASFDNATVDYGKLVKIINAREMQCPLDEVYTFSNMSRYIAASDLSLRSKCLQVGAWTCTIQGYSFLHEGTSKDIESTETTYTSSTFKNDGEIFLEYVKPLSLYVKDIPSYTTFSLDLYGSAPVMSVTCYDKNGKRFDSSVDSKGCDLLAIDGYWHATKGAYTTSTVTARRAFSVLSDEVAAVSISMYGSLSGYTLLTNCDKIRVQRYRLNAALNNYDLLFVASQPTVTTGLIGTIVRSATDVNTAWQLIEKNGKRVWSPL